MQAVYISNNQFKVSADKTSEFLTGRRIRALCGSEYQYSTVYSSIYSSPDTTVTIEESILTSNLTEVHYGIVNIGDQGSFPNHSHNGDEGTGGEISLLTLSDTPSIYENGEYLRSTTSGVEWTIPEAETVVVRVKEENVSAITKGQVCAIVTGSSGVKAEIGLCDCDDPDKIRILGLAQDNIPQNEDGIVAYKGALTDVDTRTTNSGTNPNGETWVSGDLLWAANIPGGMTNVRPTSGRSIKAARTVKGNSVTDTLIIISLENPVWNTAAIGEDVILRVGDSAGANKVSIRNYDNDEVADFDSYGNLTLSGTVDGVDIDEFKSEFDNKTVWYLTEGSPSASVGTEDDLSIDSNVGDIYEKELNYTFTTWNPEDKHSDITMSNGNLTAENTVNGWSGARTILNESSNKWYWEVICGNATGPDGVNIGIGTTSESLSTQLGSSVGGYAYRNDGKKNNSNISSLYGDSWTTNDIIGVALDMDSGKIWFSKNGIWQASGDPVSGTNEAFNDLSGVLFGMFSIYWGNDYIITNFGALSFSYTVPTGFTGLSTSAIEWIRKLSPDFLKLSDTPTTYSGSSGKYLKTTSSGIEFVEDLYTKSDVDTISGTLQTDIDSKSEVQLFTDLNDVPTTYSGTDGYYLKTTGSGIEFSEEVNPYWSSIEPFLDENSANVANKPTLVTRGVFSGYSLPEYATGEELLFRMRVPFRWDGSTNPWFVAITSISATEDVGDKYRFQFEWNSRDIENVIPDDIQETLTYEVTVTSGIAYYAEIIAFELDSTTIVSGQNLQSRLRRIAATSSSVSNEIIIWHWCTRWRMNKLGTESIQGY